MNIFFDMDYTLIGGLDGKERPGVQDVMERLKADGHELYVWSGNGIRWPEVKRLGIEHLVTDCFKKPMYNYYQAMKAMELPAEPDLVVDDFPVVAEAFGGICIPYYDFHNPEDRQMERVYNVISEYAKHGHSSDTIFRTKRNGHSNDSVFGATK